MLNSISVLVGFLGQVELEYIGIGASPAGPVLAGPLLFKVKMKFHFCKKQVMNRSATVIFRLVRLTILLYNR